MKEGTGFLLFAQNSKIENGLFFLILLFLPTQLGRHFWPSFSYILGIRTDYLSPTLYLTDVLILLLFGFFILNLQIKSFTDLFKKRSFLFTNLIFLTLYIFLGIIFSKSPPAGLYGLLKLLEFVFFGIFTAFWINKNNVTKILFIFSSAILFESVLSIFQYLRQSSIGGVFYFFGERTFNGQTPGVANASINGELILRPYGTFSHPNVLAGYLIIGMILILFNFRIIKNKLNTLLSISALIIGTVTLFLTFSRIAILLWPLILVIFMISKIRKILFKKNFIPILIFIFIIVLFSFFTPLPSRFSGFRFSDESFYQRQELINKSQDIISMHPILGTGLNNFLIELSQIQKTNNAVFYLQPVHNIFLLVAAQTGIAGLIYFILFLAKTFKKAVDNKNLINYKIIIFLSFLILGSFDHYFLTVQQGQLLLSFIVGLIWARFKN